MDMIDRVKIIAKKKDTAVSFLFLKFMKIN